MKLELTVPEKVGLLHLLGALDLIVLVFTILYLGLGAVRYTGVEVNLPAANLEVNDYGTPKVLTILSRHSMYLGREKVDLSDLSSLLQIQQEKEGLESVLLQCDSTVSVEIERELINRVQALGLRCILLGDPE